MNDVIHLSVQNSLNHTTNPNTLALARKRIPPAVGTDDTTRFLIVLLYEKELGKPGLVEIARNSITYVESQSNYTVNINPKILEEYKKWSKRAVKIVEIMKRIEGISTMKETAGDGFTDLIRDMALIELGEKIGVQINTSTSPAILTVRNDQGIPTYQVLPANSKISLPTVGGVYNISNADSNTARPVTLTGKNGASLVTTYSGADYASRVKNPVHVLRKDATYQLTYELMKHEISSTPIEVPTVANQPPELSVATGVTESVNISNIFSGSRLTITAVSSSTSVATVQINQSQTSMGVIGSSAGTAIIEVTGTNESGSASVSFVVKVT